MLSESAVFVPDHSAEEGGLVRQGARCPVLEVVEAEHHHGQQTFQIMFSFKSLKITCSGCRSRPSAQKGGRLWPHSPAPP